MDKIRQHTWLITLIALALLLAARSLRKDLGSRRQVIDEPAPTLQAGAGERPPPEATPTAKGAPLSHPLRPSPWSVSDASGAAGLHGVLRDGITGQPLAARTLTFVAGDTRTGVKSDADGHFAFEAPDAGTYLVEGAWGEPADGDPPHEVVFVATPGHVLSDVVLHAQPEAPAAQVQVAAEADAGTDDATHALAGRVVRSDGAAVGAFELIVRRVIAGLEADAIVHRTVLSADGHFDVDDLPAGDLLLQAFARGHAPAQASVAVPRPLAQDTPVLTLAPGGTLEGVATRHEDGAPLPRAQVVLDAAYDLGMFPPRVRMRTSSDDGGHFTLPGIGAARASLQVTAAGRIPQVRPQLRLTAGQATKIELSLRRAPGPDADASAPRR